MSNSFDLFQEYLALWAAHSPLTSTALYFLIRSNRKIPPSKSLKKTFIDYYSLPSSLPPNSLMTSITTIVTTLKWVAFLYRLLIVNSNACWNSLTIIVRPIQIFSIATLKDLKITKLPLHLKTQRNCRKNSTPQFLPRLNNQNRRKDKSDKNDNVQEIKILNGTIKLKKVVKSNLFESYLSSFCI